MFSRPRFKKNMKKLFSYIMFAQFSEPENQRSPVDVLRALLADRASVV
jgi:hypothetical protein